MSGLQFRCGWSWRPSWAGARRRGRTRPVHGRSNRRRAPRGDDPGEGRLPGARAGRLHEQQRRCPDFQDIPERADARCTSAAVVGGHRDGARVLRRARLRPEPDQVPAQAAHDDLARALSAVRLRRLLRRDHADHVPGLPDRPRRRLRDRLDQRRARLPPAPMHCGPATTEQPRIDFGYRGVHVVAVAAKAIQAAYYGRGADQAPTGQGCSDGGREGLMEAQRYPDDFDGIVVGAPALYMSTFSRSSSRPRSRPTPAPTAPRS